MLCIAFYSLFPLLSFILLSDKCKFVHIPYISFSLNLLLGFLLSPSQRNTQNKKMKRNHKNKKPLKHISEKMMMEQLCENSLACSPPEYQVTVCCYKFHSCLQPQFLPPSPKLKVSRGFIGSGRNTFAHTCALFISNRCRVEGPVWNGCHLSGINNSVTSAQTQRQEHARTTQTPTLNCMKSPLPEGEETHFHLAFLLCPYKDNIN